MFVLKATNTDKFIRFRGTPQPFLTTLLQASRFKEVGLPSALAEAYTAIGYPMEVHEVTITTKKVEVWIQKSS